MEPAAERSTMAATLPQFPFPPPVCPPFPTVPYTAVSRCLAYPFVFHGIELLPGPSAPSPSRTIQLQSQNAQRQV